MSAGYWRGDPAELVAASSLTLHDLVRMLVPAPPEWHARAACRWERTNLFFVTAGSAISTAKHVCAACPVADRCLADALATPESADFGTRGGTTAAERRRIRRTDHAAHPHPATPRSL